MFNLFKKPSKDELACIHDLNLCEEATARNWEAPSENRVQARIDLLHQYDDENRELAKTWEMPFTIEKVGEKKFVQIGDVSFCAEYVSDIAVTKIGKAPQSELHSGYKSVWWTPEAATNSEISVTLVSGRTHTFECNRHCTETMLTTIRKAVKDAS